VFSAVAGVWLEAAFAFAEFHVSPAGAAHPANYAALYDSTTFRDGSVYLLGRDDLAFGGVARSIRSSPRRGWADKPEIRVRLSPG